MTLIWPLGVVLFALGMFGMWGDPWGESPAWAWIAGLGVVLQIVSLVLA